MKAVTKGQEFALACGLVVSLATGNGLVFGLVGLAVMYTWLVSPVCRPQLLRSSQRLRPSPLAELRARYGEVPHPRVPSLCVRCGQFAGWHVSDWVCGKCGGTMSDLEK
jgi:ribosomal protein S27AE